MGDYCRGLTTHVIHSTLSISQGGARTCQGDGTNGCLSLSGRAFPGTLANRPLALIVRNDDRVWRMTVRRPLCILIPKMSSVSDEYCITSGPVGRLARHGHPSLCCTGTLFGFGTFEAFGMCGTSFRLKIFYKFLHFIKVYSEGGSFPTPCWRNDYDVETRSTYFALL